MFQEIFLSLLIAIEFAKVECSNIYELNSKDHVHVQLNVMAMCCEIKSMFQSFQLCFILA